MRRRTMLAGAFAVAAAGGLVTAGTAMASDKGVNGVSPVGPSAANSNGIQVATEVVSGGKSKFPVLRTKKVDTKVEKVLEIEYQVQETGYWCGPAATRIALSARVAPPSQATLAAELGTHEGGTDHISQVTTVMNARIDAGEYFTREMPNDPPSQEQIDQLWADVTKDIDDGYAVVANIVAPPGNQPPGYPPDQTIYHYFSVIGYDSDKNTVLIGDSASFSGNQIYWLNFSQLASLIPPKGYAA
ncbi:MAG: C39 family peptidase [Stackebrandtia sp.]